MNCFEFRRKMLASPGERIREQEQHVRACAACERLAKEMESFEDSIHDAVLVAVPDGLAARVLLRHKVRQPAPFGVWALAASLVLALGLALHFHGGFPGKGSEVAPAATHSEQRAARAAISYVLDYEPQLLEENRTGDPAEMRQALMQLGLRLPVSGVTVRYLGKCPVVPDGTGEHIVLKTAHGQATLILAPSRSFASREMISHRERTAIVSPVRDGGYILIADSPKTIRYLEKTLM
jgi:hypothetical protein